MLETGMIMPLRAMANFTALKVGSVPSGMSSPSSKSFRPVTAPDSKSKLPEREVVGITVTRSLAEM